MPEAYFTTGIGAAAGVIVTGTTDIPTAGTPVQLTTTTTPCMGVFVGGDTGNVSVIYCGDSNVDGVEGQQRGIAVEPAGNSIFLNVNDASLVFFDAATSGDNAVWAYLQPKTG